MDSTKEYERLEALKRALNTLLSKKELTFKGIIVSDPGDEQEFHHITKKTKYEK